MPVIEVGVAAVEPPIIVVGQDAIARRRHFVYRVTERVGKLRADLVPRGGAE